VGCKHCSQNLGVAAAFRLFGMVHRNGQMLRLAVRFQGMVCSVHAAVTDIKAEG
jgi:hypothetical protein